MEILPKSLNQENLTTLPRRSFFKFASVGALGIAVTSSSCKIHSKISGGLNLGKGDFAVLNYAYALEQLEGAFYGKVTSNFYSGASEFEKDLLTDISHDEIAHREWFREVLFLKKLPQLEFDFSSINFKDRTSVLNAAKDFEDTGVSAYNGAGKLLDLGIFLTHAGKIVSVEARHAATIRNLISYGDFAGDDVINSNGLDMVLTPEEVVRHTDKYFVTKINVTKMPTS
ncbi:MAG: ferritin-like domain-containing protein [Bacteroidota bacterium]|nr:ferritin-like domain-containing protein [Bacteroidota bacterium]